MDDSGVDAAATSQGAVPECVADVAAFGDLANTDDDGTQRVGRALRALWDGYRCRRRDAPLRRRRRDGPWSPALLLAAHMTPYPNALEARLSAPNTPFYDARSQQWFDLPLEETHSRSEDIGEVRNGSAEGFPIAFAPLAAELFDALLSSLPREFVSDRAKPFVALQLEEVVDAVISDEPDTAAMPFQNASDANVRIDNVPDVDRTTSRTVFLSTSTPWTTSHSADQITRFPEAAAGAEQYAFAATDGDGVAEDDNAQEAQEDLEDLEAQEAYEDLDAYEDSDEPGADGGCEGENEQTAAADEPFSTATSDAAGSVSEGGDSSRERQENRTVASACGIEAETQADGDIAWNMRALLRLAMTSESPSVFDAAAARVPSTRCTLQAAYTVSRAALDHVGLLSAARRYVNRDTVRPITFADLDGAMNEAWEAVRSGTMTTPGTITTPLSGSPTTLDVDTQSQSTSSTPSPSASLPTCSDTVATFASDLSSQQALFDLIRVDVERGAALLHEAIKDIQRHRPRPHQEERDAIWPSTAYFTQAALAAFRQTGLAVEVDVVGMQGRSQHWADVAMAMMQGEARTVRALPDRVDRTASSLADDLRDRFAASLLIMRFGRDHWSSLDDDNLFDQLLTVMALWQLDAHWDRSDSLPTVSAMRRYALRLIDVDTAARVTVQAVVFLPMTYYRVRCYTEARGQTRRKRSLYLWPLQVRLRDPAYQACFIRTDAASEAQYHRQFSAYRADTLHVHAHYVAEALLKDAAIHPLAWRQASPVYDVQYEQRLRKLGGFLLYIGPAKRHWHGRIVTLAEGIRWMVCQAESGAEMATVSTVDATASCQQHLDAWSGMQHFSLPHMLAQAVRAGRFDTGWVSHAPGPGALLEQRLTVILRRDAAETDGAAEALEGAAAQGEQGRGQATSSNLFAETVALTERALRREADTFEREAYTPASAERFMRLLPFYGAIGKEWDKDTYHVNWGHLARDAAEVMLLLVSLGIPAKAAGSAALRVGSRALRAARKARLPPMARAIQVLRAALPYLGGASRTLSRGGTTRLAAGLRRRSRGAWRSIRRFYWGRTFSWRLDRRVRAAQFSPAPLHHFDQLYLSHVQMVFQRHARMRQLIETPSGMCYDAAEVGRGLLRALTDRVRYRGVLIWRQGTPQPANHIVMVVRRGQRSYVLDPTAGQFKRFSAGFDGPVYLPDAQWRALYRHSFYDEVVKFADFGTLAQTERLFGVVPRTVGEPLQGAQTLVSPAWHAAQSG